MKLNRTPNPLDRNARNGENDNWDIIEGEIKSIGNMVDDFIEEVSNEALDKVVDNAKLNWKEPVDSFGDLPSSAEEGDTRMVRDTGKVYRFDGGSWIEIQQIDAGPVNELDSRLSLQVADVDKEQFKNSFVNHKNNKRKLVVWEDDDGMAGIYTKLYPILKEYNIKMTAAIITGRGHGFPINGLPAHDSRYISYEQMKEMEEYGVIEFVSHTHTHRYFDSLTLEEVDEECRTSQEIIKKLGWNYRDIVYPGGRRDKDIIDVVRQYYDSATIVGGSQTFINPLDMYQVPRIGTPNGGYDLEAKKQEISQMLEDAGFAILLTHIDLGEGLDVPAFKELIEHCLAEGAEFVTRRELMQEFGNFMQIGNNVISSGGDIYGDDIGVYRIKDSSALNAPISAFEKGVTTRIKVRQDDADAYNLPYGNNGKPFGVLEIYRDKGGQDIYSFAVFNDVTNRRQLYRRWDVNSNAWGEWTDYNDFQNAPNLYVANAPVTDFPKGKTTRVRVTSTNYEAYNLPITGSGTPYGHIDVHRDFEQDTFSNRIFYDINNKTMLISRWSTTTNAWDSWQYVSSFYNNIGVAPSKNAPITSFAKGTTTKFRLLQNDASDYGVPSGDKATFGFVETHRDAIQDVFSAQILYDINNSRILMRRWDVANNKWYGWE